MFKKFILILSFLFIPFTTFAGSSGDSYGSFYNIDYVRNYDGDTVTFNIDALHPLLGEEINIRVNRVDTPEIRGTCKKEKTLAYKAKDFVKDYLINADYINITNTQRGKYFRIVGDIETEKGDLGEKLIDNDLAVWYDGGTKNKDWCE